MGVSKEPSSVSNWLPDWTDATAYPDPKNTSKQALAWEFLRRNPEYQEMWNQLQAQTASFPQKDFCKADEIRQRIEDFGLLIPVPPTANSSDADFKKRPQFATHGRSWMKPAEWPEDAEPYVVDELLKDPSEVMIKFDLRWSVQSQLLATTAFLKAQTQKLKNLKILEGTNHRMKPEYFADYLRLLDGEAADQTHEKMAEVIYGIFEEYPDHAGKQQVSDSLKRARWLRDKGYRFIVMAPQT